MDSGVFIGVVGASAIAAGLLGALTGLGGGVVLTPILVLALGVDVHYAVGASLVAVIATSSGSAAAYVRDGYSNIRIGMLLEVGTVFGALVGALIAKWLPGTVITLVFGAVMIWTAWASRKPPTPSPHIDRPDPLAQKLNLDGDYPTKEGLTHYHVQRVPAGFAIMFLAGALSAIAGIGSGILKVFAMDRVMQLPFKVSTTTSNFMIGVTAAASAGVYLHRGQIEPAVAAPVAGGALIGSFLGAKILPGVKTKRLRVIFALAVGLAGIQMVVKGLGVHL
ncbi:MAG: sulfite exporter TauE/SafE family protein [Phycisphaerales bacterium]